nr:unnamed protein product [Callosobruchus analis]
MANFISEKCANRLGLPRRHLQVRVEGLNGTSFSCKGVSHCTVKPVQQHTSLFDFEAIVIPSICSTPPRVHINTKHWDFIKTLDLADKNFNKPDSIDLLVTTLHFSSVSDIRSARTTVVIETVFGWVMQGRADCMNSSSLLSHNIAIEPSLDSVLQKFWEVESIKSTSPLLSLDDIRSVENFSSRHYRDHVGRFVVPLPFKQEIPDLGNSYHSALRRFSLLENRLITNATIYSEYCKFMSDYIDSNHMSLAELTALLSEAGFELRKWASNRPELLTKVSCLRDSAARVHAFCDASQVGYAAATYFRITDTRGNCEVRFICGKSKEAPLKPLSIPQSSAPQALTEEKALSISTFVDTSSFGISENLMHQFSSLTKILRIITYVRRVIKNKSFSCSANGIPTPLNIENSLQNVILFIQREQFSSLFCSIEANLLLPKPFRKLAVFIDSLGILRVGGRLQNSELSLDSKHPILLPMSHRLTDLIIEDTHQKHLHPGFKSLQYILLQRFWIFVTQSAIYRCLSRCIRCFKCKPKSYNPPMADLPASRVTQLKAFSNVCVDYAGPSRTKSLWENYGELRLPNRTSAFLCVAAQKQYI